MSNIDWLAGWFDCTTPSNNTKQQHRDGLARITCPARMSNRRNHRRCRHRRRCRCRHIFWPSVLLLPRMASAKWVISLPVHNAKPELELIPIESQASCQNSGPLHFLHVAWLSLSFRSCGPKKSEKTRTENSRWCAGMWPKRCFSRGRAGTIGWASTRPDPFGILHD